MVLRFEFRPSGHDHVCGDWRLVVDGVVISDYEGIYDYLDAFIQKCYFALKKLSEEGTAKILPVEPHREIHLSMSNDNVKVAVHHVYRRNPEIKEVVVRLAHLIEGLIISSEDLLNMFNGESVKSYHLSEQPDFTSIWRPRKGLRLMLEWRAEHGIEWASLSPQDLRDWMGWARKRLAELRTD